MQAEYAERKKVIEASIRAEQLKIQNQVAVKLQQLDGIYADYKSKIGKATEAFLGLLEQYMSGSQVSAPKLPDGIFSATTSPIHQGQAQNEMQAQAECEQQGGDWLSDGRCK